MARCLARGIDTPLVLVPLGVELSDRALPVEAGASVSLAGTLKVGTWQAKDGTARAQLDLVADEVASTTPRPRKRAERPGSGPVGHAFDDLPGAGDLDWMGA